MKTLLSLLLIFLSLSLSSQTLNLRIGNSESKGLLGAELQDGHVAIHAGYRPASTIDTKFNSVCVGTTYYLRQAESSFYLSSSTTSKGYVYQYELKYTSVRSYLFMAGYRVYVGEMTPELGNRLKIDIGSGVNYSDKGSLFTFEVVFNFGVIAR